ncbi:hypothetical protein [Gordonia sp. CPCC 205333]|uniref:hypothetical protein n=1 Tax=Gordonia sp. CPCC 205333 TaxID=3140790 RepID=UPI003AF39B03
MNRMAKYGWNWRHTTIVVAAAALLGALVVPASAMAAPRCPTPDTRMSVASSVVALRDSCSQGQFDALFARLKVAPLPKNVPLRGMARPIGPSNAGATAAMHSIWSGKNFHRGWLTNQLFGGDLLPASVFYARSILDGRAVMRIDYARSGLGFGHDEMRRLPNGVWIGYGFLNNARQVNFWMWR